jgi:hypothetical protein
VAFASIDPSDRRRELNNNALGFEEVSWGGFLFTKIRIAAVFFFWTILELQYYYFLRGTEPVLFSAGIF